MGAQQRLWGRIRKLFGSPKNEEDVYYEELFIRNSEWNSQHPNKDELNRLIAIKEHLSIVGIENKSNCEILDLGCGRGWLAGALASYGQVTGIEPVNKVVEYARKLFPRLTFFHGTAQEFNQAYPDKKFDLVVSSEVIEHIPNVSKRKFVDLIYKLLREDGYVVITTPREEAKAAYLKEYGEPGQPVEEWMTQEEVISLFADGGFIKLNHINVNLPDSKMPTDIPIYQTWLFQKI